MNKGIKINKGAAKALMALAGIVTIGFLLACATTSPTRMEDRPPGMYRLKGWGEEYARSDNVAAGIDINGEVGHQLFVDGCTAWCVPGLKWTGSHRIISGRLPPGMDFQSNTSDIQGIPTERGHWIVQVELYNVKCNGKGYAGVRQELRFHITGTGKVIQ